MLIFIVRKQNLFLSWAVRNIMKMLLYSEMQKEQSISNGMGYQ